MKEKVAFIGLGNMGAPMALNLIKAGYQLTVFDLSQDALSEAVAQGAVAADSAASSVAEADFVISMLPASEQVEKLYLGHPKQPPLLDAIPAEAVIIDCSTIAADVARQVHQAAQKKSLAMLDAPVSGGTAGASAGTLTFMIGGVAETVLRAETLLKAMGKNCFHAGGDGAGQLAKACNNLLLAICMAGTAEALSLGVSGGLNVATLSKIMTQSSSNNWSLATYNPYPGVLPDVPASRNYEGGFSVDLMIKDLGLALAAAEENQAKVPIGSLARSLYLSLREAKDDAGKKDFSSIQSLYN